MRDWFRIRITQLEIAFKRWQVTLFQPKPLCFRLSVAIHRSSYPRSQSIPSGQHLPVFKNSVIATFSRPIRMSQSRWMDIKGVSIQGNSFWVLKFLWWTLINNTMKSLWIPYSTWVVLSLIWARLTKRVHLLKCLFRNLIARLPLPPSKANPSSSQQRIQFSRDFSSRNSWPPNKMLTKRKDRTQKEPISINIVPIICRIMTSKFNCRTPSRSFRRRGRRKKLDPLRIS